MDEIIVKPLNSTDLFRFKAAGQEPRRKRIERLTQDLQEAKRLQNVVIYLKRGRYLRQIAINYTLKQKSIF